MSMLVPLALVPCARPSLASLATQQATEWCRYRFDTTQPPSPFGKDDLARISLSPVLKLTDCKKLIHEAINDERGWQRDSADRYGTAAYRLPARWQIVDVINSRPLVASGSHAAWDLLREVYLPQWEPML